jgi:hypothetical protein
MKIRNLQLAGAAAKGVVQRSSLDHNLQSADRRPIGAILGNSSSKIDSRAVVTGELVPKSGA